jgi:Ca2+-binding EF-hand superfamily protein
LDPTTSGIVTYEPFLSLCAMKLHSRTEDSISEEIESAYRLFTRGGDGPISVSHLRRVARDLKEEVSDELLRDMIRMGNGGGSLQSGVSLDQFRDVMKRAGVF